MSDRHGDVAVNFFFVPAGIAGCPCTTHHPVPTSLHLPVPPLILQSFSIACSTVSLPLPIPHVPALACQCAFSPDDGPSGLLMHLETSYALWLATVPGDPPAGLSASKDAWHLSGGLPSMAIDTPCPAGMPLSKPICLVTCQYAQTCSDGLPLTYLICSLPPQYVPISGPSYPSSSANF